ncbi:MAG: CDP-diacylglycerol--serine O-phosphatidyltransferase [Kiritimatiellia bacterium]|jgi:CDP-diacylglycerol---serine O-phosphatidyltransferase
MSAPADTPSMIRFVDAANVMTLTSLVGAVACVLLAIEQQIAYATVALILSGLCDLLDGMIARRIKREEVNRRFGTHLDSLADVCAFGFAPMVLLYSCGCNHPLEIVLLALLPICVAWRLAYFETIPMPEVKGRKYFYGLPSTYVALFMPLVLLGAIFFPVILHPGLIAMTIILMLAMVSTRRVPKPGRLAYLFFFLLALAAMVTFVLKGGNAFELPAP